MSNKNIIELNGKRYDALTGKMLADSPQSKPAVRHTSSHNPAAGHVLDGISHRPTAPAPALSPRRLPSHQAAHRLPERSKTLMRGAVKKPSLSASKPWRPVGNAINSEKNPQETGGHHHNLLGSAANPLRAQRAKTVQKSGHISKFSSGSANKTSVAAETVPLHVRPAPPDSSRPRHIPARPADSAATHNPFGHALNHATSHQQPLHRRPPLRHRAARKLGLSSRAMGVVSGSLAVLLLAGFFAYQNMPNLAMRVAARQAGFSASLPDYRPSGFSMQRPIQHQPGQVTISFESNSDNRQYRVTQRASNLNSEALLDNFQASGSRSYQTFQDKGKTIYIYDDSNATWVNGGVLYEIAGDSALSTDQLLRIASSL